MKKFPQRNPVGGTNTFNRFDAQMRAPPGLNLLVEFVIHLRVLGEFLLRDFYSETQLASSARNVEIFNFHGNAQS